MSHLTLTVTISTDGDDIASQLASWNSPHGVMANAIAVIATDLLEGSHHNDIRDVNGNRVGVWDFSQVIDRALPLSTVTMPDYLGLAEATDNINDLVARFNLQPIEVTPASDTNIDAGASLITLKGRKADLLVVLQNQWDLDHQEALMALEATS